MDVILCVYVSFSSIILFMRENMKILPFYSLLGWGLKVSVEAGTLLVLLLRISCFLTS